jgi:hypothetical protein
MTSFPSFVVGGHISDGTVVALAEDIDSMVMDGVKQCF